jgi:hypothetical protein
MKLFLSDINRIGWLSNALTVKYLDIIKQLKPNTFFVFYYNWNETSASITILHSEILFTINEAIYRQRTRHRAENVGILSEPFDTNSYLFYSVLKDALIRYYQSEFESIYEKKLNDLFLSFKEREKEEFKKLPVKQKLGTFDIASISNLEQALGRFIYNKKIISGILKITEMVNGYCLNRYNNSFYSGYLKKVVMGINSVNGGLLPEETGLMRYMIIGEKAGRNDVMLTEARNMLRKGEDARKIYIETGWSLNKFDGKWRKRISDEGFALKLQNTANIQSNQIPFTVFIPENNELPPEEILKACTKEITVSQLIAKGYKGTIGGLVEHPNLYKYYPKIADLPVIYACSTYSKQYSYYYSDEIPQHLMIFGNCNENEQYVFLHEMQHYIQRVEGFSNGGNLFLSSLLVSVGGGNVRMFLQLLSLAKKNFCRQILQTEPEVFNKLVSKMVSNLSTAQLGGKLSVLIDTKESIAENCSDIMNILLNVYAIENGEISEFILDFAREAIGEDLVTLMKETKNQADATQKEIKKMTGLGWTRADVDILFFNVYSSLAGEIEAREVQQTSKISKDLEDYFDLYTSETIDKKYVNVLSETEIAESPISPFGACEILEGKKFIIHLKESVNAEPFLHELGHIIYEFAVDADLLTSLPEYWMDVKNKEKYRNDVHEYFVENFLCYLVRKNFDADITENLKKTRVLLDFDKLDVIFDSIFNFEPVSMDSDKLSKYLEFVQKIA